MAFGYSLMKGRAGAAGYIREIGNHREVSARNVSPGAVCQLYRRKDGEWLVCGTETADSAGNVQWTAPKEGGVFIAQGRQVLLWEGGDEAFLMANAWLKNQGQKSGQQEKMKGPSEEQHALRTTPAETAESKTESGMECIKQTQVYAQSKQIEAQQAQIPKKQTEVWNEPAECHTPAADKNQTKESPPERAYTLRPAGKGEPVDTLPER